MTKQEWIEELKWLAIEGFKGTVWIIFALILAAFVHWSIPFIILAVALIYNLIPLIKDQINAR